MKINIKIKRVLNFLKDGFHGLCMACADSVPGVSGGTVAFLMGFYERFVGSINSLVFGKRHEKLPALLYLMRLGIGWAFPLHSFRYAQSPQGAGFAHFAVLCGSFQNADFDKLNQRFGTSVLQSLTCFRAICLADSFQKIQFL